MAQDIISIQLTSDEALVLFEWLAELENTGGKYIKHPAEEKVIWKIEGYLEKVLVEPFKPQYKELLEQARNRVIE